MSHFVIAVLTKPEGKTVKELLAPYQENNMGDCPKEYLAFEDRTEELKEYWGKYGEGKTLEEYAEEDGYEIHEGKYGFWENPNAKWDWYVVGGRWSGMLKHKNSTLKLDGGVISDIDFSMDKEEYDKALRFWELYIEKQKPVNKEEEEKIEYTFYKESYFTDRYKNKEEYAKRMAEFSTYAVITPDGKWHAKGKMGWFGFNDENAEEAAKWDKSFKETFIDTAGEGWSITIVDCHI